MVVLTNLAVRADVSEFVSALNDCVMFTMTGESRAIRLERLGNATRPVFGLLWWVD